MNIQTPFSPSNTENQDNKTEALSASFTPHAQYIVDLSFENPHIHQCFLQERNLKPSPDVRFDVRVHKKRVISDDDGVQTFYEVHMPLEVVMKHEEERLYILNVQYGGLFSLRNVEDSTMERILLFSEAPRYLFPALKQVVLALSADSGFPALSLMPFQYNHFVTNKNKKIIDDTRPAHASSSQEPQSSDNIESSEI